MKAQAKALATYNPTAAKATLTAAGFTYKGSKLIDPKGNPVTLNIHVISGWSDWVASNQIITKNLQAIGIDSNVALEPDWNSWYPNASSTKNPTLLWQNGAQASPYGFFNANLSSNAYIPSGQDATNTGNWEHYKTTRATTLLNQWKATLDPKKQQAIATQLEKIWLQQLPIVPLFIGPRWSTYSTKYFHCFDSPKNLLRRSDLHHVSRTTSSRSRASAPAATPGSSEPLEQTAAGGLRAPPAAISRPSPCAGSSADSSSTCSPSGWR